MRWIYPKAQPELRSQLKQKYGFGSVLVDLIIDRGLSNSDQLDDFLNPQLKRLEDPFAIKGIREAADRIHKAIEQRDKVLIYGDYDVDGVTSTAQLCDLFEFYNQKPRYFVPHRVEEGYGLSTDAINRALDAETPDLFIAVDCGTSSAKSVDLLRKKKIDVIIIDHHTSKEDLPVDCIMVNPKVHHNEDDPWYHLCSAGLVFKVIHAFLKAQREKNDTIAMEIDPKCFLDLAALGTISDLVPLLQENRILARHGLREINAKRRPGINALIEISGLGKQSIINAGDLGFRLGPRINAGGRLDDATEAVNLLITKDTQRASEQAEKLESLNKQRQKIERGIVKDAEEIVATKFKDKFSYILYQPDWHAGVVGIVASRISRSGHRPTLVLGAEENGKLIKGSGRSIDGVDLVEVLKPCAHLLEKWGGHPMAIGLTLKEENLEDFRKAFEESLHNITNGELPESSIRINATLTASELNEALLESLNTFEPFGQDNAEPILELKKVSFYGVRSIGNDHISFVLKAPNSSNSIRGVYWNGAKKCPPEGKRLQIAFRLQWNEFRGTRSPQINLIDWKPLS